MKMNFKKLTISISGFILCLIAITLTKFPQKDERAKYIFLFIGDGMGHSLISLTESYMSYKAGKVGGERLTFSNFPYSGNVSTYSIDSPVTCSAAAGTAIASGKKTINTRVGRDENNAEARSFAFDLKADGYKVGIITNAPINHATPACFYSCPEERFHYHEITRSIPESGFDFFGGCGFLQFFNPSDGDTDSETYLENNGYKVCWGREEFDGILPDADKIVLCNKENQGGDAKNYNADGSWSPENFTLDEMVRNSLRFFGEETPFFIMCEGGTIDWTAHVNRTMPTIKLIMEMDEAVKAAYEFYKKHPDETLIIVTADHDTGGASVGYGHKWINDQPKWHILDSAWNASGQKNDLGEKENKKLNDDAFIGWTTYYHTGADVPVFAIGKGAEQFCGKMDNTDFRAKILAE